MELEDYSLESQNVENQSTPVVGQAGRGRFEVLGYNKRAFIVTSVVVAAIMLIGIGSVVLASRSGAKQGLSAAEKAVNYTVGELSLRGVKNNQELAVDKADHLAVNGQLRVSNTIVLSPTAVPTSPILGQVYYDQTTNIPYFYNGSKFMSFATGDNLAALSNLSKATPGTGLLLSGSSLINTGVTGLSGTVNQVSVSGSTGNLTLSLPQDIAQSSSPTFVSLNADSLTARPASTNLTLGTTHQTLLLQGSTTTLTDNSGGFTSTLGFTLPSANRTINLPNESGTVCLQNSVNCGFTSGTGSAFVQNGNAFGALAVLGTTDNNALAIRTNNIERLRVDTSGNVGVNTINTTNGLLNIGTNTTAASGGLYFGTDTNLYRSAANTLRTDSSLDVAGGNISLRPAGASGDVMRTWTAVRTAPTVVNDTVDIGNLPCCSSIDMTVRSGGNGMLGSKTYHMEQGYGGSATWVILRPSADAAVINQNFEVDRSWESATSTTRYRIRRTSGSTAGTYAITIVQHGNGSDFVESSAVASVTPPTSYYVAQSRAITEYEDLSGGDNSITLVGIGVAAPTAGRLQINSGGGGYCRPNYPRLQRPNR